MIRIAADPPPCGCMLLHCSRGRLDDQTERFPPFRAVEVRCAALSAVRRTFRQRHVTRRFTRACTQHQHPRCRYALLASAWCRTGSAHVRGRRHRTARADAAARASRAGESAPCDCCAPAALWSTTETLLHLCPTASRKHASCNMRHAKCNGAT